MHDAILVGINTVVMDDPRLQSTLPQSVTIRSDLYFSLVNLLPQDQGLEPPQPLIFDPKLRFPLDARILKVWTDVRHLHPSDRDSVVRQPWIICGDDVEEVRRVGVEEAGARVIAVPLDSEGEYQT
jgi:2,5-diamino-6-(ribosylamino)-4(3H)-pyrimidinone 5'-phosphate reductase